MDSNVLGMGHHLIIMIHVRRPEGNHNVYDEQNVHYHVYNI